LLLDRPGDDRMFDLGWRSRESALPCVAFSVVRST
jgi:hypothetical protein